jgi:hypothetical protein
MVCNGILIELIGVGRSDVAVHGHGSHKGTNNDPNNSAPSSGVVVSSSGKKWISRRKTMYAYSRVQTFATVFESSPLAVISPSPSSSTMMNSMAAASIGEVKLITIGNCPWDPRQGQFVLDLPTDTHLQPLKLRIQVVQKSFPNAHLHRHNNGKHANNNNNDKQHEKYVVNAEVLGECVVDVDGRINSGPTNFILHKPDCYSPNNNGNNRKNYKSSVAASENDNDDADANEADDVYNGNDDADNDLKDPDASYVRVDLKWAVSGNVVASEYNVDNILMLANASDSNTPGQIRNPTFRMTAHIMELINMKLPSSPAASQPSSSGAGGTAAPPQTVVVQLSWVASGEPPVPTPRSVESQLRTPPEPELDHDHDHTHHQEHDHLISHMESPAKSPAAPSIKYRDTVSNSSDKYTADINISSMSLGSQSVGGAHTYTIDSVSSAAYEGHANEVFATNDANQNNNNKNSSQVPTVIAVRGMNSSLSASTSVGPRGAGAGGPSHKRRQHQQQQQQQLQQQSLSYDAYSHRPRAATANNKSICAANKVLRTGIYNIRYKLVLPRDLPSTIATECGSVVYYIRVTIDGTNTNTHSNYKNNDSNNTSSCCADRTGWPATAIEFFTVMQPHVVASMTRPVCGSTSFPLYRRLQVCCFDVCDMPFSTSVVGNLIIDVTTDRSAYAASEYIVATAAVSPKCKLLNTRIVGAVAHLRQRVRHSLDTGITTDAYSGAFTETMLNITLSKAFKLTKDKNEATVEINVPSVAPTFAGLNRQQPPSLQQMQPSSGRGTEINNDYRSNASDNGDGGNGNNSVAASTINASNIGISISSNRDNLPGASNSNDQPSGVGYDAWMMLGQDSGIPSLCSGASGSDGIQCEDTLTWAYELVTAVNCRVFDESNTKRRAITVTVRTPVVIASVPMALSSAIKEQANPSVDSIATSVLKVPTMDNGYERALEAKKGGVVSRGSVGVDQSNSNAAVVQAVEWRHIPGVSKMLNAMVDCCAVAPQHSNVCVVRLDDDGPASGPVAAERSYIPNYYLYRARSAIDNTSTHKNSSHGPINNSVNHTSTAFTGFDR